MLRRDTPQQRQEQRAVFGRGGSATRYKMREKLVSFGNDFWIEDECFCQTKTGPVDN